MTFYPPTRKKKVMWILIFIASLTSYALISTLVNNFRFESRLQKLKADGGLLPNDQQEHKILQKAGYDIHYYISGNKEHELLIFLPAAFCDHRTFDHQIAYFSKNYRVMSIDLMGHGLSQVKKSKEIIDASTHHLLGIMKLEGYEKAHIVGVSMGSLIAQYFAFLYPEKIRTITVVGGYNIHKDNREIGRAQLIEKMKWPLKILFSMNSFRRYVASMAVINTKEQAKVYESTKAFTRSSFKVMRGLGKIDQISELSKRSYPLLLMIGDHDLDISIKYAQNWHKEDPDIIFHILRNAGHNANMDNSEDFNSTLQDFLETKAVASIT